MELTVENLDKVNQQVIKSAEKISDLAGEREDFISKLTNSTTPIYVSSDDLGDYLQSIGKASAVLQPLALGSFYVFCTLDVLDAGFNKYIKAGTKISEMTSLVSAGFQQYAKDDYSGVQASISATSQSVKDDFKIDLVNNKHQYNLILTLLFIGFYNLLGAYSVLMLAIVGASAKYYKKINNSKAQDFIDSIINKQSATDNYFNLKNSY